MIANPNYTITMRENAWTVGVTAEGRPFALVATARDFALALGEVGQDQVTMMIAVVGGIPAAYSWRGDNLIIDKVEEVLDRYLAAVVIV